MIDFRVGLVKYLKTILGDSYGVFDGSMSFVQPQNGYITYYVANEEQKSFNNGGEIVVDPFDNKPKQLHEPMKVVDIQLDIRGDMSFYDVRRLSDSFYDDNNLRLLKSLGIGFLRADGIASLPHLKEAYHEEGYTFMLHITYDASFITNLELINSVDIETSGRNCSSSETIITVDCSKSVGGSLGTQFNLTGVWLPSCTMFKS